MLDFAELKVFQTNITTLRMMDPLSYEVKTAVYDWQQDAKRRMDNTRYYADQIKTETALFNDAVRAFLSAFRETYSTQSIRSTTTRCFDHGQTKWAHGAQILQSMDQVCTYRAHTINFKTHCMS